MRPLALATALVLVTACGCSRKPPEEHRPSLTSSPPPPADAGKKTTEPAPHTDEGEHEELPTKVRLRPEVVRSAGIKTASAVTDSLPATVDLTGEIAADPDRSARLAARVAGRIIDVKAKEGDRVKAGQTIAVLESPELARARATLASTSARARAARLNADRLGNLEAKALAAGQEVAAASAEAASLEADVAAAKQTLAAFGQGADGVRGGGARVTIRTPLPGFVLTRDAVQGQSVDAEHIIAVIGDLEHVYFLGRLFEKDLARVAVGASTEIRLNAYPNEVFEGKIETIGRQLDPAARTVTARILVRNHGDLVKVGLVRNGARRGRPGGGAGETGGRPALRGHPGGEQGRGVRAPAGRRLRAPPGDARPDRRGPRGDPERAARGRAGRRRGRLHPQERDPQEHVRRGGVSVALLSAIVAWSLRNRAIVLAGRRCCS